MQDSGSWTARVFVSIAFSAACLMTSVAFAGGVPEVEDIQKLNASDGGPFDYFSSSVAIDGDVMVIGAREDDEGGAAAGAAYVYRLVDSVWVEEQKLIASNAQALADFGHDVSISGDVILVGAWKETETLGPVGILNAGAAYVFRYDGEDWIEEQRLIPHDQFIWLEFGSAVAIDGDRLIVGAHHSFDACADSEDPVVIQNCHSGCAYIFDYDGDTWIETQRITASDTELRDVYGRAVDIKGDVALVGAWNAGNTAGPCPPTCNFDGHGAAYVFRLVDGTWVEEQVLFPDDRFLGSGDNYAWNLGFDGERIIVGSQGDDDIAINSGAGYVYRYEPGRGPEPWVLEQKLTVDQTEFGDTIGEGADIDGDIIVLAGDGDDIAGMGNVGSGFVFMFNGEEWITAGKTVASDGAALDWIGQNVAVSGARAVLSSIGNEILGQESGAAYVFDGFADCNGNGVIDELEIASGDVMDADGDHVPDDCNAADPDLNGDGSVGPADLAIVLGTWGLCPARGTCPADLNGDGAVGPADLAIVLGNWS